MAQDIIGYNPCKKIDAADIDAYFCMGLNEKNPTELELDTPWGEASVDLTPALEAAMVGGSISLYPDPNPDRLRYTKGSSYDDIMGADLSRIVSMQYLKDVAQDLPIGDGDVYLYNGTTKQFEPYGLTNALWDLDATIEAMTGQISALEIDCAGVQTTIAGINASLADLEARVSALEKPKENIYGILTYQENSVTKQYYLESEEDFNLLGVPGLSTPTAPIQFANLTVTPQNIRGFTFGSTLPALPTRFLAGCNLTQPLIIPEEYTEIPNGFFSYSTINASITLPNSISTIGDSFLESATYNYTTGLIFPTSLKSIGNNFMINVLGWSKAPGYPYEVSIPEGVTTIGNQFLAATQHRGNTALLNPPTRIVIPSTITTIGTSFMANFSATTIVELNTTAVSSSLSQSLPIVLGVSTTTDSIPTWSGYTTGITLTGIGANAWKTKFEDLAGSAITSGTSTYYLWRKLVVQA